MYDVVEKKGGKRGEKKAIGPEDLNHVQQKKGPKLESKWGGMVIV
jgi:hypothetical protein